MSVNPWRWAALAFGASLVIGTWAWMNERRVIEAPPLIHMSIPAKLRNIDYPASLAAANNRLADKSHEAELHPKDWIAYEGLAIAYLSRAKLTGSFEDYAAARKAVERGFDFVPAPGTGSHQVRAGIAMATHRLTDAEADLARIDHYAAPDFSTTAGAKAMRGDIAFYRGKYAEASRYYDEAYSDDVWAGPIYRKALLASRTGDLAGARALYLEADSLNRFPDPAFRADLFQRFGELYLVQGDWERATLQFKAADRTFPGSPRIQMRLAQMAALGGNMTAAIRAFEKIAITSGMPEAMDVTAGLYRARGDRANSGIWADRAGAIWMKRMAEIPEAAWGHALEHELAFGDPAKALDYARRNAAARPFGESQVALARALIANRQPKQAAALLEKVNASVWQSVDQHLALADAYALLGNSAGVTEQRDAALALNPKALSRNPAFVWLDH